MGIEARGFDHDVMLYAFLLDADPSGCPLEEQARRRLDLKLGPAPEQHADITLEIWQQLAPAVDSRGLRKLYAEIELPLAGVLARMERTGVRIDRAELERLSQLMEREIATPHRGDPRAGGQAVQHQLAAATGARAVRRSEAAGAGEVRQREDDLHRRRRSGGAGGGSRNRAQGAGIPPAHQAEGHLRGCAAGADRPAHRAACTPASTRRARPPDGSRRPIPTCRTFRSARSWAARSARPSFRGTAGSCWWPIIRRSSCGCWRTCRAIRCWWRRSATARTSTRARRPRCWACRP